MENHFRQARSVLLDRLLRLRFVQGMDEESRPRQIRRGFNLSQGASDTLYFSAGPNGETNGLVGTITPAERPVADGP